MSHEQTALNAQSTTALVLNPNVLALIQQKLERAKQLSIETMGHQDVVEADLWLHWIHEEIDSALDLLNFQIERGKTNKPSQNTATQTPNERAITTHRCSVDPLGYDIRILCDVAGCDVRVDPNRKPPANHRQVCLCCGNDDFAIGMDTCPQCNTKVIYRCRYVAIAGGV